MDRGRYPPPARGRSSRFFIGRSVEAARFREEQEQLALLERSDLAGMGEIEGTIYVTGHRSPDSDTVCCSIAYASLLQKLGYDAVPVVLGDINRETAYILETAGLETPQLLEDASGQNMSLVGHGDYPQSAEDLEDARIIGIIDHHGDGDVSTADRLIYDARPLGATATIVWLRYREYGVELDEQTAVALLGAVLSDTVDLQAGSTTAADTEAVKELSALAGIADTEAFYNEMFKAALSYDGWTDEEIFFSDYKEYEAGGSKFAIGCINVYDEDSAREMAERIRGTLPRILPSTGMDMAFAQISIFHDDISVTYLVTSGGAAEEVIETAYPDDAVFDGSAYRIEPGISRKQELVPAVSEVLEAHPKE